MKHRPFSRGISEAFLNELQVGRFSPLLQITRSIPLDVQLRDGYVDWYADGRRVLQLKEQTQKGGYLACIHTKYVNGLPLPQGTLAGEYCRWSATDTFLTAFLATLPAILTLSQAYRKPETTVEEALIRASAQPASPVIFFDRQVQVPGIQLRADLVGLQATADGPCVLLTELKRGLDTRIQHLRTQISAYAATIAPNGCLRDDIATAYRTVLAQKVALGLLSPTATLGDTPPPVRGLLVLYDYNPRSELLDRLHHSARDTFWPVSLCLLTAGSFQLPPPETWEVL